MSRDALRTIPVVLLFAAVVLACTGDGAVDVTAPAVSGFSAGGLAEGSSVPEGTTLRLTITCLGSAWTKNSDAFDFQQAKAEVRMGDQLFARLYCAPNSQGARRQFIDIDLSGHPFSSWRAMIALSTVACDDCYQCAFDGQQLPNQPLRCTWMDAVPPTDPYLFDEPSDAASGAQLKITLLR